MATSSSPPNPPLLLPQTPPPPQDSDHRHSSPTSNPTSRRPNPPHQSTISPPKKVPPLPWTHQETINLIQAYQEKWYSLKKGQLKANQWEEVSITVAARCGYDEPSKSAIQCRHKIEKLRKRYPTEKLKPFPNSWQYSEIMEYMERPPLPISARPMSMIKSQKAYSNCENEGSDSDVEINFGYSATINRSKSKSINHIIRGDVNTSKNMSKDVVDRGFGEGNERVLRVSRNPMIQQRMKYNESDGDDEEEMEEGNEEEKEESGGSEMVVELAEEIRVFAERFVRMENKKIEMMKETERYWMEMIIVSQRKIVDSIGSAFGSFKKMKMTQ